MSGDRITTEIGDPDLVDTFDADERGRINLGKDFADDTVKVAVVRSNDNDQKQ